MMNVQATSIDNQFRRVFQLQQYDSLKQRLMFFFSTLRLLESTFTRIVVRLSIYTSLRQYIITTYGYFSLSPSTVQLNAALKLPVFKFSCPPNPPSLKRWIYPHLTWWCRPWLKARRRHCLGRRAITLKGHSHEKILKFF